MLKYFLFAVVLFISHTATILLTTMLVTALISSGVKDGELVIKETDEGPRLTVVREFGQ